MQLSWGTKLMFVFVAFAVSISYMVYQCFNYPVNLVSKQYYKDEINYQQVIDGTKNAVNLSSAVVVKQQSQQLVIQFPAEMKGMAVKGSILFYCSSNLHKDKTFDLQPVQQTAQQVIPNGQVAPGQYIVKTNWWANNVHYYTEQPLTVL